VKLQRQCRGGEVQVVVVDVALQRSDVGAVEPVHRRHEPRDLLGGGEQPPLARRRGPHQVGDGTERRLRPVADDEAVAGREPGAGDDPG
jgi:hypothetical protein